MDLPLPGDPVRSAFVFGKLPAHGDFLRRGLGDGAADELDDYLSASLSDAAMLPDFDELYASAPAWRFLVDIGPVTMCGVIAPSVDRVGRQFPVMVGVNAPADGIGLVIDACEASLYNAFSQGMTAEALYTTLVDFPGDGGEGDMPPRGWFLEDEDKVVAARLDGNRPPRLVRRMMESARLRA